AIELVEEDSVGLLAHGHVAHEDRPVLVEPVSLADRAHGFASQAQDAGRKVLEMEDLVSERDRGVAAAAATLAGVDVERVELARGGSGRHGDEAGGDDEEQGRRRALHGLYD